MNITWKNNINTLINKISFSLLSFKKLDFLLLFSIRLYLVPWVWRGGISKYNHFADTVLWFATPTAQGGLQLPFPTTLAFLATSCELIGAMALLLGLATRIMAVPLTLIMGLAGILVHWQHGYLAIADKHFESTLRLNDFILWLKTYFPGRYNYITELGDLVVLNNGFEFALTYSLMLLVLLFYGPGRYVSCDYYISQRHKKRWLSS